MTIPGAPSYLWDTCVAKRFREEAPGDAYMDHMLRHLEDADAKKTNLFFSSLIFAEGKIVGDKPGVATRINTLESDLRTLGIVIDPTPDIMKLAGRLRLHQYVEVPSPSKQQPKPRNMSLGDAIYLATAVWIRDTAGVKNIVFHTFDDGSTKTNGQHFAPLLSLHNWCHGLHSDPDITSLLAIKRKLPIHSDLPIP